MTITHKDFLRLLPKAVNGLTCEISDGQIDIRDKEKLIRINLAKESVRKIASLTLPMTNVRIELIDFSPSEIERFMWRFDLAYQKGGG